MLTVGKSFNLSLSVGIIHMPHPCHSLWQEISQIVVEGMTGGWYDSALLLKEVILSKFQPFCIKLEVCLFHFLNKLCQKSCLL